MGLEDTQDFVACDEADFGEAVGVTECDANLGGGETLPCELTSSGVVLSHVGGAHRTLSKKHISVVKINYKMSLQMPCPGACIRPMAV